MRCRWPSSWPAVSNDRRARSLGNWSPDLMPLEGFASFAVAGAGYINGKLDRQAAAQQIAGDDVSEEQSQLHSLVEHTSINPNKSAHIGHLRNAILGDTFVRLLRAAGQQVDVQNYIDNTGVQVADVVVGLTHFEGYDLAGVQAVVGSSSRPGVSVLTITAGIFMRRVSQWYEDPDGAGAEENSSGNPACHRGRRQ